MDELERAARATYGRHLLTDEAVVATADATAAGTGRTIGTGAAIGALIGALIWATLDNAALLPLVILGSLAGTIGGGLVAARQARRTQGPGASAVKVVLTNQRLMILRQRSAYRTRPLRSYPLDQLAGTESRLTAIGRYHGLRTPPHRWDHRPASSEQRRRVPDQNQRAVRGRQLDPAASFDRPTR